MSTTTATQLEHQRPSEPVQSLERQQLEHVSIEEPRDDGTAEGAKFDRATYFRLISAGFAFFVAGVNDGSIGALVPYIIRDYDVDTAIVSSV